MSTETVSRQAVPAGTWTVDPVHPSITFAITHNGFATFRSGFGSYEARLSGGEQPQLEGAVDVASIEIGEEQLKGHLLSPDFFDAERHPQLRFASTELERRRGRNGPACSASWRSGARSGRSRRAASSGPDRRRPRRQSRASASRSRRRSTGATSASTGRRSCPAAARRSTTRSAWWSSWSWSRRTSNDAGPRHLRSLRRDSFNSAPSRAAAERLPGGAELVEYDRLARDPALRRGRRSGGGARTRCASCARRSAAPTRS